MTSQTLTYLTNFISTQRTFKSKQLFAIETIKNKNQMKICEFVDFLCLSFPWYKNFSLANIVTTIFFLSLFAYDSLHFSQCTEWLNDWATVKLIYVLCAGRWDKYVFVCVRALSAEFMPRTLKTFDQLSILTALTGGAFHIRFLSRNFFEPIFLIVRRRQTMNFFH